MNDDFQQSGLAQQSRITEVARLVTTRLKTPKIAAFALAVTVLIAAAIFTVARSQDIAIGQAAIGDSNENQAIETTDSALVETTQSKVFVHVVGAVHEPGVLELKADARVVDAIEAAGGVVDGAAVGAINLARRVVDGEQINVPTEASVNATSSAATNSGAPNSLLNINTADANALESLPGVGPALAARIIDWRTSNGSFRTVDDLDQVSGIGNKLLESIRSLVSV